MRLDPGGIQAERRVLAGNAVQLTERTARVQGQFAVGVDLGGGHRHAVHQQPVGVGRQLQVVADVHRRHQEADVLGELAAHALDARHQFAALVLVHQRDQAVAHFQAQRVDRAQFVPAQLGAGSGGRRGSGGLRVGRGFAGGGDHQAALVHFPGDHAQDQAERQKRDVRHAGHQADQAQDGRGHRQCAVLAEDLADHGAAHVLRPRGAGHQQGDRRRDQQGRQLRHQAVTDGQQRVGGRGIDKGHVVLEHAHRHAADEVDEQDQDGGDGVAADELVGTVHCAVEVGFLADLFAAGLGFFTRQQTGVEVGVDGHLLAGHRVQDEAGGHFRHAPGTLGDDHEVDDGQDREYHDAHGVIAADHELAEGLDHLAGCGVAVLAVDQDHAAGGDVQRQPQHRGHQQHDRENGEFQRALHIDHRQQHHQRDGDVEGEQRIQHRRGQRHHQHGQHGHQGERGAQAVAQQLHHAAGVHRGGLGAHALAPLPNSSTSSGGRSGIGPPFQPRSW